MSNSIQRARLGAVLAAAALAITACGGGSSSVGDDTSPAVDEAVYESTIAAPPTDSPAPVEDKTVWVVSCGQAAAGCQAGVAGAEEAAKALGWTVKVCDGKFNAAGGWGNCVRQAVAAKADAIATFAIDCVAVKAPLTEAKAADVPVVNFYGFDCDDPATGGGDALFATSVTPSSDEKTSSDFAAAGGRLRAEYAIAKTGGKAVALNLDLQGPSIGTYSTEGFKTAMNDCAGCKVYDASFTLADLGGLRKIVDAALLKHPDVNIVNSPLDSLVLAGAGPSVASSGRADKITVISGEGLQATIEMIKGSGPVDAVSAEPTAWWGWAAMDTTNRLLAGEDTPNPPEGIGFQIVDKESNLPTNSVFESEVDFRSLYKKAWGVE